MSRLLRAGLGPMLLLVAAGLMCVWTWQTWPDALIDFGRELYVAWQLSEGAVLHRDVAYLGGPLSPYLNALWFRAFGTGIDTLVAANLVILLALLALLYRLLVSCGDRLSATAGCLSLLLLFAFGRFSSYGSYNFAAPYSHDLTHGVFLAIVAVACLVAHARTGRESWLAGTGLTLGLVFLTKAEAFAATALAVAGGLGLWLRQQRAPARVVARRVGWVLGAALVPPGAAWLLLVGPLSPAQALEALLGSWHTLLVSDVASLGFYRQGMGTDHVGANLARLLLWSLGYVLLLAPALVLARVLRPSRAALLAAWLLGLGSFAVLACLADRILWLQAVRPLPLAVVGLLVWSVAGFVRCEREAGVAACWLTRVALLLLAGGLLVKIVLNSRVYHYGFALAMPGFVLLVAACTGWIPARLDRAGRAGVVFRASALGTLAAFLVAHLLLMQGFVDQASYVLGTGRDQLRVDPLRGQVLSRVLDEIRHRSPRQGTLAVFPEGVMLNYLARRPLAIPEYSFTPFDFVLHGEAEVLRKLERSPPQLVVLAHRETPEYGARRFGLDYARALDAWLRGHYRTLERVGDPPFEPGSRFGAVLLERETPGSRRLSGSAPGPGRGAHARTRSQNARTSSGQPAAMPASMRVFSWL